MNPAHDVNGVISVNLPDAQAAAGMAAENAYLRGVLRSMFGALLVADAKGIIVSANPAALSLLGYGQSELLGRPLMDIASGHVAHAERAGDFLGDVLRWDSEQTYRSKSGREIPVMFSSTLLLDDSGEMTGAVCVAMDLSDRKRLETELRQAQRLESLGTLASGLAHEINSPLQFIGDGLHFLKKALSRFQATWLPETANTLHTTDAQSSHPIDLAFFAQEAFPTCVRCEEALAHVAGVVDALKEFSRPATPGPAPADLNQALCATITVAASEYRRFADVTTDLGALPPVLCHLSDLKEVFLNLIVNAGQAIADAAKADPRRGTIT